MDNSLKSLLQISKTITVATLDLEKKRVLELENKRQAAALLLSIKSQLDFNMVDSIEYVRIKSS